MTLVRHSNEKIIDYLKHWTILNFLVLGTQTDCLQREIICWYGQNNEPDIWKKTKNRKSEISQFLFYGNEVLNYHMEQGEEKQCYRNSLMQNQILGTLQQWMKRKYTEIKLFCALL